MTVGFLTEEIRGRVKIEEESPPEKKVRLVREGIQEVQVVTPPAREVKAEDPMSSAGKRTAGRYSSYKLNVSYFTSRMK